MVEPTDLTEVFEPFTSKSAQLEQMNREVEDQEVLNRVPLEVERSKKVSQKEEAEALNA